MGYVANRLTLIGPIIELNRFIQRHESLCFLKLEPACGPIALSSRHRERLALKPATDGAIEYGFDTEANPWDAGTLTADAITSLAKDYPSIHFQHVAKYMLSDW